MKKLSLLIILISTISLSFADTSIFMNYDNNSNKEYKNEINKKSSNKWALGNFVENVVSPYTLQTGSVIQGVTISKINSDTQGMVTAQVSQNIYDSVTGRNLLIPSGTKIIGIYASQPMIGSKRLTIMWNRLVFPNGRTLDIGNMPASSFDGSAGIADKVNNHLMKAFSNALMMTLVMAAVSYSTEKDDSDNKRKKSPTDYLSDSLGQQIGAVSMRALNNNINISPTLEIRSGYMFNIIVVKDIVFDDIYR